MFRKCRLRSDVITFEKVTVNASRQPAILRIGAEVERSFREGHTRAAAVLSPTTTRSVRTLCLHSPINTGWVPGLL